MTHSITAPRCSVSRTTTYVFRFHVAVLDAGFLGDQTGILIANRKHAAAILAFTLGITGAALDDNLARGQTAPPPVSRVDWVAGAHVFGAEKLAASFIVGYLAETISAARGPMLVGRLGFGGSPLRLGYGSITRFNVSLRGALVRTRAPASGWRPHTTYGGGKILLAPSDLSLELRVFRALKSVTAERRAWKGMVGFGYGF